MTKEDINKLRKSIEAMIFISGSGLTINEIAQGLDKPESDIETILNTLLDEYMEREGGIHISDINGKYRFLTNPDTHEEIRAFLKVKRKQTLSKAMLETLAIITYKQPITLGDVDEIRGVNSRSLITGLINRKLIKISGQKDVPGKPSYYATTKEFLDYFGLNSLKELPPPKEIKELSFDDL